MKYPVFSILIATTPARKRKLDRLLSMLDAQIETQGRDDTGKRAVEVLIDDSDAVLGSKRQKLLLSATGKYVCVVDDDDLVEDDYVARVVRACQSGLDCVSLLGRVVLQSGVVRPFHHSIQYAEWGEEGDLYVRCPNHLNPVRRSLAWEASFPEGMAYGEDHEFSRRLRPLLKTQESGTGPGGDEILYHYFERGSLPWRVSERAKILVKWATRGRPALFRKTLAEWAAKLSGKNEVFFVVSLDADDDKTALGVNHALENSNVDFYIYGNPARGKVAAINANIAAHADDFDILVLAADDVVPTEQNWDERIVVDMLRNFPLLDGLVTYDDGFQVNPEKPKIATVPVMGRKFYEKQGYIYNPAYHALWCDQELSEVAERDGKLARVPKLLLRHDWIGGTADKDALLVHNESFYRSDEAIYLKRKAEGFPT